MRFGQERTASERYRTRDGIIQEQQVALIKGTDEIVRKICE